MLRTISDAIGAEDRVAEPHRSSAQATPSSLGVAKIADRYRVAPATVREWLRIGALKGLRIGRDWHVSWQAVFAFEGCGPTGRSPRQLALARTRLLKPQEVARPLEHSADTILSWRREGRLSGCVIGGRLVRFRCDWLEKELGPDLWRAVWTEIAATTQNPCKATDSRRREATSR